MKSKIIRSNAEIQSCIETQQEVEVWVGGEFDDICTIETFNVSSIRINGGFYYLRQNVVLRTMTLETEDFLQ